MDINKSSPDSIRSFDPQTHESLADNQRSSLELASIQSLEVAVDSNFEWLDLSHSRSLPSPSRSPPSTTLKKWKPAGLKLPKTPHKLKSLGGMLKSPKIKLNKLHQTRKKLSALNATLGKGARENDPRSKRDIGNQSRGLLRNLENSFTHQRRLKEPHDPFKTPPSSPANPAVEEFNKRERRANSNAKLMHMLGGEAACAIQESLEK